MKLNLQSKYTLAIVAIIISIVITLMVMVSIQFKSTLSEIESATSASMGRELLQQIEKRAGFLAQFLSEDLVDPVYQFKLDVIKKTINTIKQDKDVAYVYVYDLEGRIIHDGTEDLILLDEILEDAVSKNAVAARQLLFQTQGNILDAAIPIKLQDNVLGGVRVGISLNSIHGEIITMREQFHSLSSSRSRNDLYSLVWMILLYIVGGVVIAILVARKLTHPIQQLTEVTKLITSKQDFNQTVERVSNDEIGDLANSFNLMIKEIKKHTNLLEHQVQERTKELHLSNEGLELKNIQLNKSEIRKTLILDTAGEGIYGLDIVGNTIFVNPAAAKMLGYSVEELIGKPQHALIHHSKADGTHYPKEECHIYAAFKDGNVHRENNEVFWHKDGSSISVEYTSTPIMEEGKITGAVVTFKDITEQKLLQAQLSEAQKMESVGQLAAGVAHEINTPMQFIGDNTMFLQQAFNQVFDTVKVQDRLLAASKNGGISDKLVTEVEASWQNNDIDYLSDEIPLAIKQSLEGVERVTKIIGAMKEFSHPGSEEKVPTDINQVIESTLTVCKGEWKYVTEVETELAPNLPLVPCFVSDLSRAILNTVVNAAHAIEDKANGSGNKGTITLSTHKDGDWIELRIQDTGCGIPGNIRSRIFDPFFTTKEVGKGTGQGLSIVHSIVVKEHQGTVGIETEQGKGTTFIFRLPLGS